MSASRTFLSLAEHFGKALFQRFEVSAYPGPNHDAVRVDGLVVPATTLPRAYRTEETVFGEDPYCCPFPLNEGFLDEPTALRRDLMSLAGPAGHSTPTLRHQLGFSGVGLNSRR